mgnify:CR=1 FL=1
MQQKIKLFLDRKKQLTTIQIKEIEKDIFLTDVMLVNCIKYERYLKTNI